MTTFILIRHGESEANRQRIFAGQVDPDLQNKGLKQAQETAKYIAANYQVDKIYSSDLKRAYNTAKCLADILKLEIIPNRNLREINAGKWEGMKFDDIATVYAEEYYTWINHIGHSKCGGGETVKQLGDRIMSELTKIAEENDGKTVAIATHATPIRTVQSIIQTGALDEMENIPWVSNASVTILTYNNHSWNIVKAGEDKHLSVLKTELPQNV